MDLLMAVKALDGTTFKFISMEKKKQIYTMREDLKRHVESLKETRGIDIIERFKLAAVKLGRYIIFATDHAFKVRYIIGRREKPLVIIAANWKEEEYDIVIYRETDEGAKFLYNIVREDQASSGECSYVRSKLARENNSEDQTLTKSEDHLMELTFSKELIGGYSRDEHEKNNKARGNTRGVIDLGLRNIQRVSGK